jgi:hypothetical protein
MANRLLEKYVQVVRMDGINTNKDVTIGVNGVVADLSVSGDLTVGGSINFAATTFDDPVTMDDTLTANGAATFNNNVTFSNTFPELVTFSGPVLYGTGVPVSMNNIQNIVNDLGNTTGASTVSPTYAVYTANITGNATIDLNEAATRAAGATTFVLTLDAGALGGETVDFAGDAISDGTITLAAPGDKHTITFTSDGTNWCEISRSGPLV